MSEIETISARMKAREVGACLGLTEDAIWDLARRGQIPHRRLNRRVVFLRDVIEKWLADTEAGTHAP